LNAQNDDVGLREFQKFANKMRALQKHCALVEDDIFQANGHWRECKDAHILAVIAIAARRLPNSDARASSVLMPPLPRRRTISVSSLEGD